MNLTVFGEGCLGDYLFIGMGNGSCSRAAVAGFIASVGISMPQLAAGGNAAAGAGFCLGAGGRGILMGNSAGGSAVIAGGIAGIIVFMRGIPLCAAIAASRFTYRAHNGTFIGIYMGCFAHCSAIVAIDVAGIGIFMLQLATGGDVAADTGFGCGASGCLVAMP